MKEVLSGEGTLEDGKEILSSNTVTCLDHGEECADVSNELFEIVERSKISGGVKGRVGKEEKN